MLQRYKIALVVQGGDNGGGVASVCWFLNQVISSEKRFDVHLLSLETTYNSNINLRILSPKSWNRGAQIVEDTWRNIPSKHVGTRFSELEFQRYMPRRPLTDLLNQFDLVQVIAGGPAAANVVKNTTKPICLFIATLTKLERKSILRQANFPRKIYGHMMLPIVSSIERQVLKRVDHVFAETEYTRQAILPYIDPSKVTIDTIGVDTYQFKPISENERSDDYILSVGRFEDARKNVVLLFEAYALLRKYIPDAPKLILAGKTAPSPVAWAKASELGITEYILIKKGVTQNELIALYQNAALYVLSSDEEGLGIVLLEAMACATPVVSTRCGGPDSVVSDKTGFLIPVGDADALADRILWMIQNPEQRRKMGQAGRLMVESRFSNEVVGEKYLDVYEKLLGADHS